MTEPDPRDVKREFDDGGYSADLADEVEAVTDGQIAEAVKDADG